MTRPIHEILKETRINAGIDLETASRDTFIPMKFLLDMENGNWHIFPSIAHRIGFLKKYLEYLKIPSEILLEYPGFNPSIQKVETSEQKSEGRFSSMIFWVSGVIVIFLFSLFFIVHSKFFRSDKNSISTEVQHAHSSDVDKNAFNISIKATEDAWVRVMVDGEKFIERILKAGEIVSVSGVEMVIRTGNAGGTLIEKDGKTSGPFGKSGQVKEIKISRGLIQ